MPPEEKKVGCIWWFAQNFALVATKLKAKQKIKINLVDKRRGRINNENYKLLYDHCNKPHYTKATS